MIMKVELKDAQMLGALDRKGRELGAAIQQATQEYTTLFRAVCERHDLDPLAVGIDFDTGEVYERKAS
jgi:hypothetical protein